MARSLGSIAASSLILATVFFIAAVMLSRDHNLGLDLPHKGSSEQGTRQFAWDGGDRLEIRVPAKVTLVEGSEPAVIVRGPEDRLARINFSHGSLSGAGRSGGDFCPIPFFCDNTDNGGIEVELRGVHPSEIDVSGAAELKLGHVDQESLTLRVSGAGDLEGEGQVNNLDLTISGAGEARLGKLATAKARVTVAGAGDVTIAPSEEANVSISGMGHVRLATKPKSLVSSISGMGSVDGEADNDAGDDKRDRKISGKVQQTVKKALDKARIPDAAPVPSPPAPPQQHSENAYQRDFQRQVREIARKEIERAKAEAWQQADQKLREANQR